MVGSAYQAAMSRAGHGAGPLTMRAKPDLEKKAESTAIARVGTMDQNYDRDRRSPLKVVGELSGDVTDDDVSGAVGTSTGTSRVEEKLKRLREKRRDLERG
jgi:hypothetical protein